MIFRGIVSWLEHFNHTAPEFQSDTDQGYFVMMKNLLFLKDNGMISWRLMALWICFFYEIVYGSTPPRIFQPIK